MVIKLSDHFTTGRLLRFCLPTIATMIFISIYSVVDGFFVSNFVGKTAFAAINFILPVPMFLGTLGFMFGTGGSAFVAKLLGEGKPDKANSVFTMLLVIMVALGTVITILGEIFLVPLARLLGSTPEIEEYAIIYGRIMIGGVVLFLVQTFFGSFVITAEKPKLGLWITIISGVSNMVFDALLVGLLSFGVVGAAVASVFSQFVGAVIPVIYFARKNTSLLRFTKPVISMRAFLRVCGNGSSEFMVNSSISIVNMLYNVQLLKYIGENGVSAYGTLMYVCFIFISTFVGLTIGMAPIVSFNYGRNDRGELKNIFIKAVRLVMALGLLMLAFAELMAVPLSYMFVGYDEELYALTVHAFRIYSINYLFLGVNIFASSFFTALNNGAISATIAFLRTLLFQIGAVLLLPLFFGTDGIWAATNVAEGVTLIVSVSLLYGFKKKYGY